MPRGGQAASSEGTGSSGLGAQGVWGSHGDPATSEAPAVSLATASSLPRGLLAVGFLDPVQIPFNYHRQMAMLVIGGNRIRVPGDRRSRGGGAVALPGGAHQQEASFCSAHQAPAQEGGWKDIRSQAIEERVPGCEGPGIARSAGTHPGTFPGPAHFGVEFSGVREPASPTLAHSRHQCPWQVRLGECSHPENGAPAGSQGTRAQDESLIPKASNLDGARGSVHPRNKL